MSVIYSSFLTPSSSSSPSSSPSSRLGTPEAGRIRLDSPESYQLLDRFKRNYETPEKGPQLFTCSPYNSCGGQNFMSNGFSSNGFGSNGFGSNSCGIQSFGIPACGTWRSCGAGSPPS
jgi:hypothetical protein